jgi:hypothetical protein
VSHKAIDRWKLPARFRDKVRFGDICWVWQGGSTPKGYGRFWDGERMVGPHRFAYALLVEPIPEGKQIDHLCRNPSCVNPDHLDVVTPGENTHRGFGPTALNARKTHCSNGHEFTPANTRTIGAYGRGCRLCDRRPRLVKG